jgi:hypothetical protein
MSKNEMKLLRGMSEDLDRGKSHIGRDKKRYESSEKVKEKQYKTRPTKLIDPDDPTTWPKSLETRREKLMYLFDILSNDVEGTYKQKWIDDYYSDKASTQIALTRDIMEGVADLNAVWRHGGFRNIPLPMAEMLMLRMANRRGSYSIEELRNPNPETRPFSPSDIIAIAIAIARFYFMGSNPVFARLIKKTVDVYGEDIGLRHLAATADRMATYEGMFDLSKYDDI